MKIHTFLLSLLLAPGISHSAILVYNASLSGPNEAPPNASPGIGTAVVTLDTSLNTMRVQTTFSGLTGTVTAAHIHAPTAVPFAGNIGVASQTPSFTGFPLGVTAGVYDVTFDMTLASSYNATYITNNGGTPAAAFSALQTHIAAGKAYFNIHSTVFPTGEIRGFLVPEPSAALLAGASAALAFTRRRRR